jgi:hypothetical protein
VVWLVATSSDRLAYAMRHTQRDRDVSNLPGKARSLMMKVTRPFFISCALACFMACGRDPNPAARPGDPARGTRVGISEVSPLPADRVVAGETIYVPAYSSILTSNEAHRFQLAVTLSVRNTDLRSSIYLIKARYYDDGGRVVRDYVSRPLRIDPMASAEYFVTEADTSGGISASFVVEWVADQKASAPVVQTVMVGTASTQGVSFVCTGRVLTDRSQTAK